MGYRNDTSVANVDTDPKLDYLATLIAPSVRYIVKIISIINVLQPTETTSSGDELTSSASTSNVLFRSYLQDHDQYCVCKVAFIKEGFKTNTGNLSHKQ